MCSSAGDGQQDGSSCRNQSDITGANSRLGGGNKGQRGEFPLQFALPLASGQRLSSQLVKVFL